MTEDKCNRCGHEWYRRKPEPAKNCPNSKCNSPYWNKQRVFPEKNKNSSVIIENVNNNKLVQ